MPCNKNCRNKAIIILDTSCLFKFLGFLKTLALPNSQDTLNHLRKLLFAMGACSPSEKLLVEESVYREQMDLNNPNSTLSRQRDIMDYYDGINLTVELKNILAGAIDLGQVSEEEYNDFCRLTQGNHSQHIKNVGKHDKKLLILASKQNERTILLYEDRGLGDAALELYSRNNILLAGQNYNIEITPMRLDTFFAEPYKRCKLAHDEYMNIVSILPAVRTMSLNRGTNPVQAQMRNLRDSTVAFSNVENLFNEKEQRGTFECWNGTTI